MRVTYQHKNVKEIAIVVDSEGRVWLKANKATSRVCFLRWIENRCDYVKQFPSREAALEAALKVCPIFHGTAGPVAQIQAAGWAYGVGYVSINACRATESYCYKQAPDYTIAHYYSKTDCVTLSEWSDKSVEEFSRGMAGRGFEYSTETVTIAGRTIIEHWWRKYDTAVAA